MSKRYSQASNRAGSRKPGRSDQAVHNACCTASSASWWSRRIRNAMPKSRSIRSRARASNAFASPRAARATSSSSIETPLRSDFDRLPLMGHSKARVFIRFEIWWACGRRGKVDDLLRGHADGSQLAHSGRSVRLRQLPAVGVPEERVMRERGGRRASEAPGEADLDGGRSEEVAAADDEVHALAQVIDDDRERIRPVAVAIPDGHVAVSRHLVRAWTDKEVHPCLRATTERDAQHGPVERTVAAATGTTRAVPAARVIVRPLLERGPRAVAAVCGVLSAELVKGRSVRTLVIGLPDGTFVGHEPEPLKVLEQRGVISRAAALSIV